MPEVVFDSKLLKDGHLYCPKEYAIKKAHYKVIVSITEYDATDTELELAAVHDSPGDYLTKSEIEYYLKLDDK